MFIMDSSNYQELKLSNLIRSWKPNYLNKNNKKEINFTKLKDEVNVTNVNKGEIFNFFIQSENFILCKRSKQYFPRLY